MHADVLLHTNYIPVLKMFDGVNAGVGHELQTQLD
jgi:hypothetical protein